MFDAKCLDFHSEECSKCNLTCDLFVILEGFLLDNVLMSGFSRHEMDILIKDVEDSKHAIMEFQVGSSASKINFPL